MMSSLKLWWHAVSLRMRVVGLASEQGYVMENLSMLLSSGMDVISALNAIKLDAKSKNMRAVLRDIVLEIENGSTLWSALERSRLLSGQVIALIHIGEESGKLAQNLQVIAIQQQKERDFTSKVRSAMMYPILVMGIAVVIGLGMAWFVLPRLVTVFDQLHIQLPLITRVIIAIAKFLQVYGNIAIPSIAIAITLVVYVLFIFPKSKWFGQMLIFIVPGVSRLIREVELSRMGYVMGSLLTAGLPITQALDSLIQATNFYSYKKFFIYVRSSIEEGYTWEQALRAYKKARKVVPTSIQQMIIAGDSSGQLPQTFLKIGEIFEAKTDTTAKNLTVILEPILLVIVWLGVASVALAIIMPIYGLIGGLTDQQGSPKPAPAQDAVPVASATLVPSITPVPSPNIPPRIYLKITSTPTNVLNVRRTPELTGTIMTKVIPGEQYEYVNEAKVGENIWYQIVIPKDSGSLKGWVIDTYVELIN